MLFDILVWQILRGLKQKLCVKKLKQYKLLKFVSVVENQRGAKSAELCKMIEAVIFATILFFDVACWIVDILYFVVLCSIVRFTQLFNYKNSSKIQFSKFLAKKDPISSKIIIFFACFFPPVYKSCPLLFSRCAFNSTESEQQSARTYSVHTITAFVCARYTRGGGSIGLVPDIHGNSRGMGKWGFGAAEKGEEGCMRRLWFSAHDTLLPIIQRTRWAHCESVERWWSITASEVEPLCQFA